MFRVVVKGIVQAVGFRPFVYRTAKKMKLKGYVRNFGDCVEIVALCNKRELEKFVALLKNNSPPLSKIESIKIEEVDIGESYDDFYILKSEEDGKFEESIIPPDIAICEKCLSEIFDPKNRRYLYPFTVCTDCGARFSIIEDMPYDREKTSMKEFKMCEMCRREYKDPLNRRYHAEPIACEKCGPKYELYRGFTKLNVRNPIKRCAELIDDGYIVAIMGIGGTHLACDAQSFDAVAELRKRIKRKFKPFAVMVRDIKSAKKIAYLSKKEVEILESFSRPILVSKSRKIVAENVAPNLDSIGIMLPYSGVHYILFKYLKTDAIVLTSMNVAGEPMIISREEVLGSRFQDYSLVHNRRIVNRVDDSVVKVVAKNTVFIRRSRGYVPLPIKLHENFPKNYEVVALGAQENTTACILKGRKAYLTQHIGDLSNVKTLKFLEEAIERLAKMLRIKEFSAVAVDMHPLYASRSIANKFGDNIVEVQHHFAHAYSLLAERNLKESVVITLDSVGYGIDSKIWGGEILVCSPEESINDRFAHLEYQPLAGGEKAIEYPERFVAGVLKKVYGEIPENVLKNFDKSIVEKQLNRNLNVIETSSCGRILDGIAYLLGVCEKRTYEGEPAIKLEAFARKGKACIKIPIEVDDKTIVTTELLRWIFENRNKYRKADIAMSAERTIACALAESALRAAKEYGIKSVGISGGVAYNNEIVAFIKNFVEKNGYKFYINTNVPCGDGGVSLGQAAFAVHNLL